MDCPIGKHEGTFGYFYLTETSVVIHKKILFKTVETEIPYSDIANVGFGKAIGLNGGYLCIRSRSTAYIPLVNGSSAACDETSLSFPAQKNEEMFMLYNYLDECAQLNGIDVSPLSSVDIPESAYAFKTQAVPAGTISPSTEAIQKKTEIDATPYYQQYRPNRISATKALMRDCGLDIGQAKKIIDDVFAENQMQSMNQTSSDAITDFKKALHPKKSAYYDKKAELEKANVVYCPKCLSTSISANQKGFGFARGALGAAVGLDVGMIAGGIGSKKVICTCLKCGHKWTPGGK